MRYFVDGYNLLFRTSWEEEELKIKRDKIVHGLAPKVQKAGIDLLLVFDSQHQVGPGELCVISGLQVYFTDYGETADEYILAQLRKAANPRECTVVTSDTHLAIRARRKGAYSQTIHEFMLLLNRLYKKKNKMSLGKAPLPPHKIKKIPTQEEYYQKIFEKNYIELDLKSNKETPRREKESKPLSDYERWLKAFEKEDGA